MATLTYPDPELSDGVMSLRAWTRGDHEQRLAGFSDPLCQRFSWPHLEPFTERHQLEWVYKQQEEARLRGEEIGFAIVDATEPDLVWGGCSIYDVNPDQGRAGIGYWLAGHARGHGIATRAVRELSRWTFAELPIARLELTCAPDNLASQRVAERCGFTWEGVLRSHIPFKGARRDSILFSLLPTDFTP
ncbi:MAG: GNAT family N-acetyltransferase [Nocardia sp.]|nr:GNAT family N-acetyltransferase [Nocardia sp.]